MKTARTDHVDVTTRSSIMRAVKNRRVKSTELSLRARLVAAGLRGWRMYAEDLLGTPDFVFPGARLAIFVDGCFWHGCPSCYRRPRSSQSYWDAKVRTNKLRDHRIDRQLRRAGWSVRRIWEHELRHGSHLTTEIAKALALRFRKSRTRPSSD
jgi:DNA mismatch endonuclease (patch repair protein)